VDRNYPARSSARTAVLDAPSDAASRSRSAAGSHTNPRFVTDSIAAPARAARPAFASPPARWWRPVHAWLESYRSVQTRTGLGPDKNGVTRRFGCVRPVASQKPNDRSTNFTTRWAESLAKGWRPRPTGRRAHVLLQGRRLFKIPLNQFEDLQLKKPNSQWSVAAEAEGPSCR
jgi:hypothetical protein